MAKAIGDLRDAAFSIPLNGPSDDAAMLRDRAAAAALGGEAGEIRLKLVDTAIDGAVAAFCAMQDDLAALEHDLTRDPLPVWSPVVLARTFAEAVILVRFLIEPEVDTDTRMARVASALLVEDQNGLAFAKTFDKDAPSNKEWTTGELQRGGISIAGKKVTVGAATVDGDFLKTDEVRKLLPPETPEPYRLFSGVSHARPWALQRTAKQVDGVYAGEAATLEAVFIVVASALRVWVTTWTGYFGLDASEALPKMDAVYGSFIEAAEAMYP